MTPKLWSGHSTAAPARLAAVLLLLLLLVSPSAANVTPLPTLLIGDDRIMLQLFGAAFPSVAEAWGPNYTAYDWEYCSAPAFITCYDVIVDPIQLITLVFPPDASLVGTLPDLTRDVIGAFLNIQTISVAGNTGVSGPLPLWWGQMSNLLSLDLSSTNVSGTLPWHWFQHGRLGMMNLSSTSVNGTLPAEWSEINLMEELVIRHEDGAPKGQLTGSLPDYNWPRARKIDLRNNQLSGTLPKWDQMPNLEEVSLAGNGWFCGCAPDNWKESPVLTAALDALGDNGVALQAADCDTANACGMSPSSSGGGATPSSSGGGATPSSSGGGATPNPVEPGQDFYDFCGKACPAGTLDPIPVESLGNNREKVCCDYYSRADPYTVTQYCGDELLSVQGDGSLHCVSTIDNHAFTCCASVTTSGSVTNAGRSCPAPTHSSGEEGVADVSHFPSLPLALVLLFMALG